MTYSYTQISQYLTCPRRYRYRYLDGWKEKDTRAAVLFGRPSKTRLLLSSDTKTPPRHLGPHASAGHPAARALAQDGRVHIRQPRRSLQVKFTRPVSPANDFVAYVDALGKLDGKGCLLEWKTTASRYPEEPDGLLALDPQLVCYSRITGISDVAQVVFVRKRMTEVQYLKTTITDEQRREFGRL